MNRSRAGRTRSCLLLGLFFLCFYLFTASSDLKHNGDTDLRYQTTQAMVDHHRLWIAHPMWLDAREDRGRGGHLYVFYGPAQSVLMIPLYVAGKALAHHSGVRYDVATLYTSRSLDLLLGALLVMCFFLLACAVGFSNRVSSLLTLLFGLATAVWPDVLSGLEQTQVELLVLLGVLCSYQSVHPGKQAGRWIVLAGTAVGLAVVTRYDSAFFAPLVPLYALYLWWHTGQRARAFRLGLAYGLSIVPWLVIVGLWDYAKFGSPLKTGLHERTFGGPFVENLAGLLLSPGKGLTWYVPVLLLLPFATARFWRRDPALVLHFAILVAASLCFYANVLYWHGDPAWGPRYLYPVLPYLILPLGEVLSRWHAANKFLKGAILGLVVLSFAIQASASAVTPWRFWYRLEVQEEQTANAQNWTGQPFHWGAAHYHYYWDVTQSPLLIQFDNVAQVGRLALGDRRYNWLRQPGPYASNPADNYPINTFAYWWADARHPLFGPKVRVAFATLLALAGLTALLLLLRGIREPPVPRDRGIPGISTFRERLVRPAS